MDECILSVFKLHLYKINLLVSLSVSVNTNDVTLFDSDRLRLKETHPSG